QSVGGRPGLAVTVYQHCLSDARQNALGIFERNRANAGDATQIAAVGGNGEDDLRRIGAAVRGVDRFAQSAILTWNSQRLAETGGVVGSGINHISLCFERADIYQRSLWAVDAALVSDDRGARRAASAQNAVVTAF